MDDSGDLVQGLLVHRVAALLGFGRDVHSGFHAGIGRNRHDVGAGSHHLLGGLLAELEHPLQHPGIFPGQPALLPALLHQHPDFLGRVDPLGRTGRPDSHQPEDLVGQPVEQPDGPRHEPGKPEQRSHHQRTGPLGIEEGHRLGSQFAQHDMQHGDDGERHRDCHSMQGGGVDLNRQTAEQRLDQVGQGRLPDPPQSQGGQGDPQLGGRDIAVERLNGLEGQSSFSVAGSGHLLEPGPPGADQGELGRNEEGVGEDQRQNRQEA